MGSFQSLLCVACDVNYSVFVAVAVESYKSCPFNKDLLRCLDIFAVGDRACNYSCLGAPKGLSVCVVKIMHSHVFFCGKQMYLNSLLVSGL